jgi:ankyrin repeat protein
VNFVFSQCSRSDSNAIVTSIDNNDTKKFKKVIDNGFNINSIIKTDNYIEYTPLLYAIENNKIDIVRLLIENNVNMELCYILGSPLTQAADKNLIDIVRLLVENGTNVNNYYRTSGNELIEGKSALYCATINFNFEMYDYLIKHGANVNGGRGAEGDNVLIMLIGNYPQNDPRNILDRDKIIRMIYKLIDDGINLNYQFWYGNALTTAADRNDIEIMEILLKNGACLSMHIEQHNMSTYDFICTFATKELIELINKYYKQ